MSYQTSKIKPVSAEEAQAIALEFVGFLASDHDRLGQFMAITGTTPGDLKASLGDRSFLAMLLDFALQDEALLVEFARQNDRDPAAIAIARRQLPGGHDDF